MASALSQLADHILRVLRAAPSVQQRLPAVAVVNSGHLCQLIATPAVLSQVTICRLQRAFALLLQLTKHRNYACVCCISMMLLIYAATKQHAGSNRVMHTKYSARLRGLQFLLISSDQAAKTEKIAGCVHTSR
jgi:hypothetical protein